MAPVVFRLARSDDLPKLIELLVDDDLGKLREEDDPQSIHPDYLAAFEAISRDPHHELVAGELDGDVVATLQLSFLPGLSRRGSWRAQIEAVRVDRRLRGSRIGQAMMEWAIQRARDRGCRLVQLTSDKQRPDAIRFYERLGFQATHEGFKLQLPTD